MQPEKEILLGYQDNEYNIDGKQIQVNKLYLEGLLADGENGMHGYCPNPVVVSPELMLKIKSFFKPRMEILCHYKFVPTPKGRQITLYDITLPATK